MYYTKESTPPVKVNIYAIRKSGYEVEFYTFFFSKSANMKKENKIQKMTLEKCRLCLKNRHLSGILIINQFRQFQLFFIVVNIIVIIVELSEQIRKSSNLTLIHVSGHNFRD